MINETWTNSREVRSPLKKLTHLNSCRLYLNILYLRDMTHPDGKTINHNYLVGVKPRYPTSKLKWPTQKYPSVKVWKLWNSTIKKVFHIQNNSTLAPFSRLREWLTRESKRNMTHQWYHSPSRQDFFNNELENVTIYFTNRVDFHSLKIILDSMTAIEGLY